MGGWAFFNNLCLAFHPIPTKTHIHNYFIIHIHDPYCMNPKKKKNSIFEGSFQVLYIYVCMYTSL